MELFGNDEGVDYDPHVGYYRGFLSATFLSVNIAIEWVKRVCYLVACSAVKQRDL